jgi:hypothetical protein
LVDVLGQSWTESLWVKRQVADDQLSLTSKTDFGNQLLAYQALAGTSIANCAPLSALFDV